MMDAVTKSIYEKEIVKEIDLRINKIIREENSFVLGLTEIISGNFDFIFRYLYAVAVLLLMAGQFTH
jgi:hypothetical protein